MMKGWRKIVVKDTVKIIDAIKVLDRGGQQIILIVSEENKLEGVITDGDVRRAILKGINFNLSVKEIMNNNPIIATKQMSSSKIRKLMKEKTISKIPYVNSDKLLEGLYIEHDMRNGVWKDRFAVIMCGGLGKRLGEITSDFPKPLLSVGSKPILETIIDNLVKGGCQKIYLSVNYKSQMIKKHFGTGDKWDAEINYLEEEKKLGTAGGLSLLKKLPERPFIVMNGDILTNIDFQNFIAYHEEHNSTMSMCVKEYDFQIPYGVVKINEESIIEDIVEKPIHNFFVSAGIYLVNPEVLKYLPKNESFDMPELFHKVKSENGCVSAFPIREYWLDIGKIDDFRKAQADYGIIFK